MKKLALSFILFTHCLYPACWKLFSHTLAFATGAMTVPYFFEIKKAEKFKSIKKRTEFGNGQIRNVLTNSWTELTGFAKNNASDLISKKQDDDKTEIETKETEKSDS